ncbi:MAG: helicase C-terminal domain-containing protein [Pseudomonadota bacterium]
MIKEYFSSKDVDGYSYAYKYPGINRVLQAAGRVIRSADDKGSIMLIDERYRYEHYRKLFPGDWKASDVSANDEADVILGEFWGTRE